MEDSLLKKSKSVPAAVDRVMYNNAVINSVLCVYTEKLYIYILCI